MTWLVLALGGLRKGLAAIWGVIARHPWQAALVVVLALCAWLYHGRKEAREELAQHIAAERAATGAQKRVNQAATKHYEDVANVADTNHADMVADAFDATQRYIAKHRLQPADRACQAPAPAASGDPGVPPEVPAGIVVGEADVRACADLYVYSVASHDWAQSLKVPENLLPER